MTRTTLEDRAEATAGNLRSAALDAGMVVSGDARVSESDAAVLLGYAARYLAQLRLEGKGPTAYGRGLNGCRVSYRLTDLAEWIESAREDW